MGPKAELSHRSAANENVGVINPLTPEYGLRSTGFNQSQ